MGNREAPDMILFTSVYDWCNVSYNFAKAVKEVGGEAEAICLAKHPLAQLPEAQASLVTPHSMYLRAKSADMVVMCHSELLELPKVDYVFHGGTKYRLNFEAINDFYNPKVKGSFIQTNDLFLGAKNEMWLMPPIDTEKIVPRDWFSGSDVVFAHYPRHATVKESATINYAFYQSNADYIYSEELLPWEKNLERISQCDVYVEAFGSDHDFGVTAMEAAALGKVVITHFRGKEKYEKEFGECPFLVANTKEELLSHISYLNGLKGEEIRKIQHKTRDWIVKNQSYKAIGRRLRDVFGD